jgi:hypothetical protein
MKLPSRTARTAAPKAPLFFYAAFSSPALPPVGLFLPSGVNPVVLLPALRILNV